MLLHATIEELADGGVVCQHEAVHLFGLRCYGFRAGGGGGGGGGFRATHPPTHSATPTHPLLAAQTPAASLIQPPREHHKAKQFAKIGPRSFYRVFMVNISCMNFENIMPP